MQQVYEKKDCQGCKMIEVGRVCVKIAGRDAGRTCAIIDIIDEQTVLIDGQTRRRKCNIAHLEISDKVLKISKNADNKAVCKVLNKEGIECKEKVAKPKKEKPAKTPVKKPAKKKSTEKSKPKAKQKAQKD